MNRKQILKNIEKNSKNKKNKQGKDGYFKFVTTIAVMLLVLVLAYFIVGVFFTKEINFKKDDESKDSEEISVDNSIIMLGELFDQHDDEYYVLIYDFNDEVLSLDSWLSVYESSSNPITVYKVDSSKKFNSKYIVTENGNSDATTLSDLKVVSPTLIKVANGKITEYIEGEDSIREIFKNS